MSDTVYLLHFSQPYKHAKHYLGTAKDLETRLEQHANGTGARLMQVIREVGLTFELARVWPGSRKLEKQLKRQKNSPRLCPVCRGGDR